MTDKEQRLKSARFLLEQARINGGTAKQLAALLRISPSTLSHWQSKSEAKRRRVAAPTDAQMQKLVGYLCHLTIENLEGLKGLASGYRLRSRERLLLQGVMRETFVEHAKWWVETHDDTQRGMVELVATLRKRYEIEGSTGLPIETLRSLYNLSGLPEPEDIESGEINFDRLCPPPEWNERFIKSMMLAVEDFMANEEEREQNERDATVAAEKAGDETPK